MLTFGFWIQFSYFTSKVFVIWYLCEVWHNPQFNIVIYSYQALLLCILVYNKLTLIYWFVIYGFICNQTCLSYSHVLQDVSKMFAGCFFFFARLQNFFTFFLSASGIKKKLPWNSGSLLALGCQAIGFLRLCYMKGLVWRLIPWKFNGKTEINTSAPRTRNSYDI